MLFRRLSFTAPRPTKRPPNVEIVIAILLLILLLSIHPYVWICLTTTADAELLLLLLLLLLLAWRGWVEGGDFFVRPLLPTSGVRTNEGRGDWTNLTTTMIHLERKSRENSHPQQSKVLLLQRVFFLVFGTKTFVKKPSWWWSKCGRTKDRS